MLTIIDQQGDEEMILQQWFVFRQNFVKLSWVMDNIELISEGLVSNIHQ